MITTTSATAQGNRTYQEDRIVIAKVPFGTLLAVADGHGGSETSHHLADILASTWTGLYTKWAGDPVEMFLKKVFVDLDAETRFRDAGSTLSVVFVDEIGSKAAVAVLGDSPVIIRQTRVPDPHKTWVSPEHNVRTNMVERAAVQQRGGFCSGGYCFAHYSEKGLQMTRAFGDIELGGILSREPEIFVHELNKPACILVASDGLIDPTHVNGELNYETIVDMLDAGAEAKELVSRAVKMQTNDNASAIVWRNK
jgi:serine/threonine protein phosphatase PrpC